MERKSEPNTTNRTAWSSSALAGWYAEPSPIDVKWIGHVWPVWTNKAAWVRW